MHLFSGEAPPDAGDGLEPPLRSAPAGTPALGERVTALEAAVAAMREELEALKAVR
jgi:uncharacterized protein YceH (UPF0502 family)